MAVYMSAARQRRRIVLAAVVALLVGLVLGLVIGRTTASGVDDALRSSKDEGRRVAAALRALPLEYEQAYNSSAGENTAEIQDAIKRVADQANAALGTAKWLGSGDRARVTKAVQSVIDSAAHRSAPSQFATDVERAATEVDDVFALTTS